ncbi:hypothetical protein [uncultured Christiangramia sp.]|uniref:hypothetical protein n=1 Tax=Christiangramia sp. 3-2217-3z TaxID=3417564 RepID=UPI00260F1D50|nr:hypothetical protein [uncultured Christiangramia sp.]
MNEFLEYLSAIWPLTPLLLFIIAVTFRLLDNSTSLFLQKDILVNHSNVSRGLMRDALKNNEDERFKSKLKTALIFRNLHHGLMILAAITLPISLILFLLR